MHLVYIIGTDIVVSTITGAIILKSIDNLSPEITTDYAKNNTSILFTTDTPILNSQKSDLLSSTLLLPKPDSDGSSSMSMSSHTLRLRAAGTLTLLVGLVQLLLFLLRLGNLFRLLAPVALRAFCAAAAIHVIATQIGFLFGYQVLQHHGPLRLYYV